MSIIWLILMALASFLVGAIPFGFLAGKIFKGIDIREHGSRNVGATNVFRVVGWWAGILVYGLDAMKGMLPVAASKFLWSGSSPQQEWYYISIALLAILGHVFTPFLGFKGGKGVATASGAMLALAPLPVIVSLAAFLIVLLVTRWVSLSSIVASFIFPIAISVEVAIRNRYIFTPILAAAWFLTILILITHRTNIVRLLQGREPKISLAKTRTPGHDQQC